MDPFAILGGLIAAGWVIKKVRDLSRPSHADGGSGDDDSSPASVGGFGVDSGTGAAVSSSDGGSGGHGHGGGDCGGHGGCGGGHGTASDIDGSSDQFVAFAPQFAPFRTWTHETDDLVEHATEKLRGKRLDLIVGNDISQPDAGFEVDTNRAVILDADGGSEALPLQSKSDLAGVILDKVARLLDSNAAFPERSP